MVTKRDDNRRPTTDDRRQGEYRAICLWKMDWQSFAILHLYFSKLSISPSIPVLSNLSWPLRLGVWWPSISVVKNMNLKETKTFSHIQGGRGWLAFVDRSRIPLSFRRAHICSFLRQKNCFLRFTENRKFVVVKELTHTDKFPQTPFLMLRYILLFFNDES